MVIGQQEQLLDQWQQLLEHGGKYLLQTGGLDYQKIVRIESPGWDDASSQPGFSIRTIFW